MKESALIQQQKPFKILLLGDDCLDVYQFGTVDRISPEAPVPVFKYGQKKEISGMGRNVFRNLEQLGCSVDYFHGETSIKTRLVDQRSKQHILRIDDDKVSQPLNFGNFQFQLETCDAVVISDYCKGSISYELVEKIIEASDSSNKFPVFVDTKKHDLYRFQGAWVKINETEYQKLTSECTGLIVTLGSRGARVWEKELPAKQVEVSDVCGAGDTFLSALTVQYLMCRDIEESVKVANTAAGITVQHLGNYAPTWEEILNARY